MRRAVSGLALGLSLWLLAWVLARGVRLPTFDFDEYWAAGSLLAEGQNPYDLEALKRRERDAGRQSPGVPMLNPPWSLPVVLPFGLLELHTAHLLWLLVQFAALLFSADSLWRFFGGDPGRRWLGWLIGLTFVPAIAALTAGQISPLGLLGAVAFLHADRAGRPILAGAATFLLAIKPHLVLPFFAVLLLTETQRRRWQVLLAGVAAGLLATGVTLCFHPGVVAGYIALMTSGPPGYDSPTLGTLLRLALGVELFSLHFLPSLAGFVWAVWYWRRNRHQWRWEARLSLVLLVAMQTAVYGAWLFDLVLLLIPVMEVAARGRNRRLALLFYLLVNGLAVVQFVAFPDDGSGKLIKLFWFFWMTPVLLLAYLWLRRRV